VGLLGGEQGARVTVIDVNRLSLIFISGVSVLLLVGGIVLRLMGRDDLIESRSVFIFVGTLGIFIGNALWSLTARVARLEKELAERK
jgi:hypothetical protein